MEASDFAKRFGGLIVVSLVIALILSATIAPGFWWSFWFVFGFGFVLIFVQSEKLKFKHAVLIWLVFLAVYALPWYAPGVYDGVTSRFQIEDWRFGKKFRSTEPENGSATTDNQCRQLAIELQEKYSDDSNRNQKDPTLDPVEKSIKLKELNVKFKADLAQISENCNEPPTSIVDDIKTITADYRTGAKSSNPAPSGNGKTYTISSREMTDTGISLDGKTVSIRVVGSNCWDNGGKNAQTQCGEGLGPYPGTLVVGAPIGALIAKTNSGYKVIGASGSVHNATGKLKLGMNDIPGKTADNNGSLTVEIKVR